MRFSLKMTSQVELHLHELIWMMAFLVHIGICIIYIYIHRRAAVRRRKNLKYICNAE